MSSRSFFERLLFSDVNSNAREGDGPVLVHGLEGFTDSGNAVKLVTHHLKESFDSELVVSFDVDSLIDFRARRPQLTYSYDQFTDYTPPSIDIHSITDDNGTSFLLLSGLEPDFMWNSFVEELESVISQHRVSLTLGVNAIPMATPHTRPVPSTAHSSTAAVLKGFETWPGENLVPASVGLLMEYRLAKQGHTTAGITAHVPYYLARTDFAAAACKIIQDIEKMTGLSLPHTRLKRDYDNFLTNFDRQVGANDEVNEIVRELEQKFDEQHERKKDSRSMLAPGTSLPSGDELGAEFEKFLAGQSNKDAGDSPDSDSDTVGDDSSAS